MGRSYNNFAVVADDYWRSFGPEFADLVLPLIDRVFRRFKIRPDSMLDLACGTGTFALRMAARGINVTALDGSRTALRIAKEKAAEGDLKIRWILGDMTCFTLKEPVDLITSIFNSVNHLLSFADLLSCFRCVRAALRPGSYFVFDVNNKTCFQEVWGGVSLARIPQGLVIRNDEVSMKTQRAKAHLSMLLKQGTHYSFDEDVIEERWYTEQSISRAARLAGLRTLSRIDFNPFPRRLRYSNRIKSLWVMRRDG